MIAVPADTPVTTPEELPTVATAVLPLVQVPPDVASKSVEVEPMQYTAPVPVGVAGFGFTVKTTEVTHPEGAV